MNPEQIEKAFSKSEVSHVFLLKDGSDKSHDWKLSKILKFYKGGDGLVLVPDRKTPPGILLRNINRFVSLLFNYNFRSSFHGASIIFYAIKC